MAFDNAAHHAFLLKVENVDRQVVISGEKHRGLIQRAQVFADNGVVADPAIAFGSGVFVWIVRIDAIGFVLGKQNGLCAHFEGALHAGIVGGEKGIADAAGKNDDVPLVEMPRRDQANKRFCDRVDRNGGHHAHFGIAFGVEHAAQHQAVDDRAQHADVVGLGPLDAPARTLVPAKDVAAADDDANFNAPHVEVENFVGDVFEGFRVKSRFQGARNRAATEFENNPFVPHAF